MVGFLEGRKWDGVIGGVLGDAFLSSSMKQFLFVDKI